MFESVFSLASITVRRLSNTHCLRCGRELPEGTCGQIRASAVSGAHLPVVRRACFEPLHGDRACGAGLLPGLAGSFAEGDAVFVAGGTRTGCPRE